MKVKIIKKQYQNKLSKVDVFQNLEVDLDYQGFVLLYGQSGAGKTTLFQIIAGIDKSFDGEVIGNERIEYMTQKIELFENLTVMENLKLVCVEETQIYSLLVRFQMEAFSKKKVKLLSGGEKQRVQIIRSLLVKPDILLCDEPTASLDEQNAIIVCELLKEISKELCVIVVSHDVSLMKEYSDTILKLTHGQVVIEQEGNKKAIVGNIKQEMPKRTRKDMMDAVRYVIRAHHGMAFCTILLLFSLLFSIYSVYYYTDTNNDMLIKDKWYYSDNLVQMKPVKENGDYQPSVKFKEAISSREDVAAYVILFEWMDHYAANFPWDTALKPFKIVKYYAYPTEFSPVFSYMTVDEIDDDHALGSLLAYQNPDAIVFPYELSKPEAFPLVYGNYPQIENEVMIDERLADFLCEEGAYQSKEDMIGKPITLDLSGHYYPYDKTSLPLTISGITSLSNAFERRVFFKENTLLQQYANVFDYDEEEVLYNTVKLLLEPQADIEEAVVEINTTFPLEKSEFSPFDLNRDVLEASMKTTRLNTGFVMFIFTLTTALSFGAIILLTFFFRAQFYKETNVLAKYGYEPSRIYCLRDMCYIGTSILLGLFLLPLVIQGVNMISFQLLNRFLFQFDWKVMIIAYFISAIVYITLMSFVRKQLMKQRKRR